jgi:hypothetical protein
MLTKPQVRERLIRLAAVLDLIPQPKLAAYVRYLETQLYNKRRATRGNRTSLPITAARAAQIRVIHQMHPKMPQHEIAKIVGANQGRTSEVLAGKRA